MSFLADLNARTGKVLRTPIANLRAKLSATTPKVATANISSISSVSSSHHDPTHTSVINSTATPVCDTVKSSVAIPISVAQTSVTYAAGGPACSSVTVPQSTVGHTVVSSSGDLNDNLLVGAALTVDGSDLSLSHTRAGATYGLTIPSAANRVEQDSSPQSLSNSLVSQRLLLMMKWIRAVSRVSTSLQDKCEHLSSTRDPNLRAQVDSLSHRLNIRESELAKAKQNYHSQFSRIVSRDGLLPVI